MKNSKSIFQYMIPGIVGLLFNSLYIIVDGIFVSQMLGSKALAAVTLVVPIVELIIALSLMIAIGTGIYISFYKGKDDLKKANEFFNQGFRLMLLLSLIITFGLIIFRDSIVNLLGAPLELIVLTHEYYLWFVLFIPFFMMNFALSTWIRNDGKPKLAMVSQVVGAIVNIALDYILMGPLALGLKGAAIATGLGPVVGLVIVAFHFYFKQGDLSIEPTKVSTSDLKDIIVGGIPSFTIEFSLGVMTFLCNIFIVKIYGNVGIATFGVLGYLNLIVISIFLGMGQGTQPLISELEGKNNKTEIKHMYKFLSLFATLIGFVAYILLYVFKDIILKVFISNDPVVYELTSVALKMFFIALPLVGFNIITASIFEARRRVIQSVTVSLLRSFVFLLLTLVVFSHIKDGSYIWYAVPLAETFTFITITCFLLFKVKRV